jgi:eukaryotic-like serine/threonine-protein kinase
MHLNGAPLVEPGKQISHYRVVEKIGRGGWGEVFLAEDVILGRRVALKFLMTEENAHRYILAEARSAASLDHPYICKVFETGEYEGKPFIAMEFLEGETLSHHLKSGQAPLSQVLNIAIEICEALAEAHAKGMIHCDLKPSNIMITRSGHVKLMDFGLARSNLHAEALGDDATRTMIPRGPIMGTPSFMAPEQARGQRLDARTDIFAFGIVLFEMVSGTHPFRGATRADTIAAILHQAPPEIAAPPALKEILRRALAKNPAERYDSAGALASDLASFRQNGEPALTEKRPGAAPTSIAILPFQDLSPQRDQGYFCDGLAEELILALSRIERLRVVARGAAFRYRDAEIGLKEIGHALNADTILEGSVRKAGERVRIVAHLVDVESGYPIWSERYDRTLDDIFEIQEDISRAIAEKMRVTLAPDSSKFILTGPENIQAYEFYLKGRYFWNKRTEESLKLSIAQFERALGEDPGYALAYAGIADAWVTLSLYGAVRPMEALPLARSAADRALSLKPELPQALTSRAVIRAVFDWDWRAATREFETAIGLDPRYAQARQWFAMNCLAPRGLFARAREELKAALELDPVSLAIAASLGALDLFAGDQDAALQRLRAVLELDDSFYLAHYFLGQVYSEKQMHDEAVVELERAFEASGSSESVAALGYARALAGRRAEALASVQELSARAGVAYVSPVLMAKVQIGLGDFDAGIANLEQAYELRSTDLIWLGVHPAFRKIRSHDRVVEILTGAGLQEPPTIARSTTIGTRVR